MFKLAKVPTQEEYENARKEMEEIVFTAYCMAILQLIMEDNKESLERLKVI